MSVSVWAGSTTTTAMPHGLSSNRSASAAASSANFDAQYAPISGNESCPLRLEMNTIRAVGASQPRQHRLRHRDLPDDVDVELPAKVGQGHGLHRAGNRDAGVVDHRVQPLG